MKIQSITKILWVVVLLLIGAFSAAGQNPFVQPPAFAKINLAGPRMGITVIPGDNEMSKRLKERGIDRMLSQFGWHFEYQVVPDNGGPAFVVELVPLISGVEYGTFIPTSSLALGIRLPNGFEFGLGPNLLATKEKIHTSLLIALGKSFNYGGVNLPVNLVCATSPEGNRFSVIFGYAIVK